MDHQIKFNNFVNKLSNTKFCKYFQALDKQISSNLYEGQIETRPADGNGIWCCALIPAILVSNTVLYDVSDVYKVVTFVSVGLLFYSLLFIVFLSISCLVLKDNVFGGCVASSFLSCLLVYSFLLQDLTLSMAICFPSIYLHSIILRTSLSQFKKTFTVGEAMIVSQSIVLFALMTVVLQIKQLTQTYKSEDYFIIGIINSSFITFGLIICSLLFMTEKLRKIDIFITVLWCGAIVGVIALHLILGVNCIMEIMVYLFMNPIRTQLVSFWLFLVGITLCILIIRTKFAVQATTVARKSFHLLASIVFMTGIIWDINLMKLASGVGLGLMVLTEVLRKSNIEPISPALQAAFLVYADEKDCGSFAMTPLYLFCGLACPLALCGGGGRARLDLLGGVLSIGVGDAAASWFGAKYGFNKWANSKKSYEGTTFNILSQIVTVYALLLFKLIDAKNALIRTAIAALITGLVEAKTDQVDNVILPLVSLLSFQLTWFLS